MLLPSMIRSGACSSILNPQLLSGQTCTARKFTNSFDQFLNLAISF
jgi:hypothetical protein